MSILLDRDTWYVYLHPAAPMFIGGEVQYLLARGSLRIVRRVRIH